MKTLPGFAAMTALYIVIGLIVVGGGAYFAVNPEVTQAPVAEPGDEAEQEADETADSRVSADAVASASGKVSIAWKLEETEVEKDYGNGKVFSSPATKVTVIVNGAAHEIGTYDGSCSEIGADGGTINVGGIDGSGLLTSQGEVAAVQCWYGGGGPEIGVFKTESGLAIKVGDLSEPSAELPGFRGNFKTVLELTLKQ